MDQFVYNTYVQILKDELLPAMGCTEPIAVAYAGAVARQALGKLPDRVVIEVSRNIIKNVKSVIVPHTGGMRGLEAACAAGIVAGRADRELEVIAEVSQEQIEEIQRYIEDTPMTVDFAKSDLIFDICITVYAGEESAFVRIVDYHTNLVTVRRGSQALVERQITGKTESAMADKSLLTIQNIFDFANEVKIEDVKEVLDRQIAYNMAIAEEGLRRSYGANIGRVILNTYGENDVKVRARAMAAAGSDARMNGCELPVVINSGSGNQGITASVPVIVYAQHLGSSPDRLYRALVVSNLSTLHIKPAAAPGRASPISRGATTTRWPTPWSTAWPFCRAPSATGPRPPAPPRSPPPWTPAFWAIPCTKTARNFWAATASSSGG